MILNDPQTISDVTEIVKAYDKALVDNDLEAINQFFLDSDDIVRYGPDENLYGSKAIAAFRASRPAGPKPRNVTAIHVITTGKDHAVAHTEFLIPGSDKLGRQTQCWSRFPDGWKIIGAHVSYKS
ncbi:TPA: AtzH-like domain-containing protein [Klebsiella pneumoniae]|nr:DUF3225 domain-containing protein [Klebsiella pneumoniae]HCI6085742.1 DUF3225 domain-containing protein [Klebsiella pneumoniae]